MLCSRNNLTCFINGCMNLEYCSNYDSFDVIKYMYSLLNAESEILILKLCNLCHCAI